MKKYKIKFQKIISIILIGICLFTGSFIAISSNNITEQTLSKHGSRGEEVKSIQTKLKENGLYNGEIDGIFGNETQKALKQFQKKNNLNSDGIAGPQTLAKLNISTTNTTTTDTEVNLLARIISAESRGEQYIGQVAVGAVVLNRVESPLFPDTLAGVIYQPGAFTAITDGQFNEPTSQESRRAAQDSINGQDPTGGALYYYNPDKTNDKWIRTRPVITRIGKHLFAG
ncbi:MAG: spore cortex-lytic enzyme [Oscillospiraceae bacterium]|nr:spore cortex-lytic enzyme [Oscillospiraceae bacterium]